jgi:lipopolysaccharide/colanic/teichoic acid biosynthesis glycosyltransferase
VRRCGVERLAEIRGLTDAFHDITVSGQQEAKSALNDGREKPDLIVFEPTPAIVETCGRDLVHMQVSGTRVVDFVNWYSSFSGRIALDLVDDEWLLQNYRSTIAKVMYNRVRRTLDIVGGLTLILVSLIPCALIVALIVVSSPGSPLFTQERLGRFRQPFVIYKLRTMKLEAEKEGPQWAQPNDSRVTSLGALLRRSHLDELPQAWNLVRGDLTLIGPRPIRAYFADQLTQVMPYYEMRFLAKPGLSGWSQVIGPYGSNVEEHKIKLEMDLYYTQNAGLFLDLYILMRTARLMLGERAS